MSWGEMLNFYVECIIIFPARIPFPMFGHIYHIHAYIAHIHAHTHAHTYVHIYFNRNPVGDTSAPFEKYMNLPVVKGNKKGQKAKRSLERAFKMWLSVKVPQQTNFRRSLIRALLKFLSDTGFLDIGG